jgi:hypothetical protein
MDEDPVLRALSAELERDDPALAALLNGAPARRESAVAWLLLPAIAVVVVGALLAPAVTFGVLAMLLVLASPLLVCLWCTAPGEGPVTGRT